MQDNIKQTGEFRVEDLLYLFFSKWYWFAFSVFIAVGIGIVYLLITPPVYVRATSIVIKEGEKGQSLSGEVGSSFSELGLFPTNTNVNNELLSLQSPALMLDVVKRLHLDVNYSTDGRFYRRVLYGRDLPVRVAFVDLPDNVPATFTMRLFGKGKIELTDFTCNEELVAEGSLVKGGLNDTLATPVGKVIVQPVRSFRVPFAVPIYVSRPGLHNTTEEYVSNLSVVLSDEKATVINLSFKDICIQRAEEVLNMLVSVYNENWVRDKNRMAVSTSMFINERLRVIERELGNVDDDISSYKSEHLLPDVQAASSLYMTQSSEISARILALNTQLSMARYIRDYLTNASGGNQLLPVNSGLESSHIESQISDYNTMQLQRNNLVANSSEQNPLVIDLDQSLKAMQRAIISSIDNLVVTLNTQIANLRRSEEQTTTRIAANPTQAKYLLSVERQQKVKEALYLFLLQKREENELSQAFTAYNTRVIMPPSGRMTPTAPNRMNVLGTAFLLGLLIPFGVLFCRENLNTTVRGRKDLEGMTVPFVGEIPLAARPQKRLFFRADTKETDEVVVKERNRNIINEAFRVVRTNVEFMTGRDGKLQVIMLSSINQGSGKTFISINLAASLAIKKKKVLAVDFDLRWASLSRYVDSPKKGISDYLSGRVDDLAEIVVKGKLHPCLDVIPVGTIPPNPTELLAGEGLEKLLKTLRAEYDYIFIDCPPVEVVADAAIIAKWSDLTLFIVRAGLLDRRMLPEIEKFYAERRFKNMCMVLNGTSDTEGRYGHRYGYAYGYGGTSKNRKPQPE